MDSLDRFAQEAARFEAWATRQEREGAAAVREALTRIASLYLAALQLPHYSSEALGDAPEVKRLEDVEMANVVAHWSLPIHHYGEVFDPLIVPPEAPVIGSIADDIGDIYRDVVSGLRAYQSGNRVGAGWDWSFLFAYHWGEHATGAIRALHACLEACFP